MERVEHRIKLNLMKTGLQGQVNVKKADTDSRKVCIYLSYAAKPFDLNDVVSAVLRAEKPDARNVFLRKYWFFDTVEEIAARYGFSESKVKAMLHRTRNRLRTHLTQKGVFI